MSLQKNEQGIAHLVIAVFAVVLAGVGATGYYVMQHQTSKTKNSETATPSVNTTLAEPLPTTLLPISKVKELAVAKKPSSTILGVDLENENGVLMFKVKLADKSVLTFNATTGALITDAADSTIDGEVELPTDAKAVIDFIKARSIAIDQMPKATVQKIELELEDGVLVYSVRFTDGSRVDVSAIDGSVVKSKVGSHNTSKTTNKTDDKAGSTSGTTEVHSSGTSGSTTPTGSHDSTESGSVSGQTSTSGVTSTTEDSSHGGTSGSGGTSGGGGSTSGSGSGH